MESLATLMPLSSSLHFGNMGVLLFLLHLYVNYRVFLQPFVLVSGFKGYCYYIRLATTADKILRFRRKLPLLEIYIVVEHIAEELLSVSSMKGCNSN